MSTTQLPLRPTDTAPPPQRPSLGPRRPLVAHAAQTGLIDLAPLGAILLLSAYLRFAGLGTNPGWDLDEGYNVNIAWNLLHGRWQMFALSYTFVQHPPLFYALGALLFAVFGADLAVLRALAAASGVLTTAFVYLAGREVEGRRAGLFGALLFAIYPTAVLHNRFAYTYDLLLALAMATLYFGAVYARTRRAPWRYAAALAAGLGLVTDQTGIALVAFVVVLAAFVNRRAVAATLGVALLPALAYTARVLLAAPGDFLFDLATTFGRVARGGPAEQVLQALFHYRSFLEYDYWIPLGLVGLVLVEHPRGRALAVGLLALLLVVTLQVREVNPFFRTAVPLLGLIALGLGVLVDHAIVRVFQWLAPWWDATFGRRTWPLRSLVIMGSLAVALGTPIGLATAYTLVSVTDHFTTRYDWALADPAAARAVAAYLNAHSAPNDLVIASANVAWLVAAHAADLHQAVAAEGQGAAFYPPKLPPHRFRFDPFVGSARFLVADPFLARYREAPEAAREDELLRTVETTWPAVFRAGGFTVYANPAPNGGPS